MTKLKNTKKGMAKKALSISLVAAMLATSNVPVWAAEDLFSDGSAAVEAPAVEEPAAEVDTFSAEPVEDAVDAVQTQATETGTGYDVTVGDFTYDGKTVSNNSVVWGSGNITVPVTVTAKDNGNTQNVYAVWKLNGNATGNASAYQDIVNNNGNCAFNLNDASYAGQKLSLYIYATTGTANDTVVWSYTSDEISINAIDINNSPSAKNITLNFTPEYDGKSHVPTMTNVNFANAGSWKAEDFTMGAAVGDTINVTEDGVYVLLSVNKQGYTGSLKLPYEITPVTINQGNVNNYFEAEFVTTSKAYTGKDIYLTSTDLKLVDKKSNQDVTATYVQKDTNLMQIAANDAIAGKEFKNLLTFPLKEVVASENANYVIPQGVTIMPKNSFSITQRDLSTVSVSIPEQRHINGTIVIDVSASNDIKFTDKDTNEELNLKNDIADISVVSSVGTHTVTITPATNNKNVTGSTTATVRIADTQLTGATFENQDYAKEAEAYTGERIVKDITKLGSVMLNNKPIDSSNYDIQFGTNIDAGENKGVIRIIGKNSYTGSEAEVYFNINPAEVTTDTITYNKFVEKKDTTNPEAYKEAIGLVVKAKNADGKEFTLTEGTDYIAEYKFGDKGAINDYVEVTLKTDSNSLLKNTNFKVIGNIEIKPGITQTTLKNENIKLKQTSYVYTGAAIEPKFDVVVDGAVISPDEYVIKSLTGNINVGTATVVITGKGNNHDFSDKVDAKATFTITPAEAEDVSAVIPSQEYTGYSLHPAVNTVDLNGVSINVKDNFTVTYGENINIGEGTIILTPKNNNFTGTKTLTFKIAGQLISGGKLSYYDENGRVITLGHTYDGTTYEVAKTVFDSSTIAELDGTLTEGTDYEIKFVDNVYGKKTDAGQKGAVLVIAKGKYAGNYTNGDFVKDGIYTDADGNKIGNVIYGEQFTITQQDVARSNVSVSNGTYAGGLSVKPVVEINVKGKTLVEGTDYELDLSGNSDMVNSTADQTLTVTVKFKNGYKEANGADFKFSWGIDKFNLANADVAVDGDKVTVKCGRVDIPTSEYTVSKDAEADTVTITAVKDSKNYTGSKTVSANVEDPTEKPDAPVIQSVNVNGNNATVVLAGESDGATGYDYVISKDRDCITSKDYDKVNKNVLTTDTTFTYTQQGVYYAYCHAWKRVDGEKVFSDWSAAYPFVVSSITPEQSSITKVEKSSNGKHLRITWTKSANAIGYDVVMGTKLQKVNGEYRPVEYGKAVKKVTNGNTVSVIFYNIPKGTYYVGLHAYNRSSESGVKVFSQWSNSKKVTF